GAIGDGQFAMARVDTSAKCVPLIRIEGAFFNLDRAFASPEAGAVCRRVVANLAVVQRQCAACNVETATAVVFGLPYAGGVVVADSAASERRGAADEVEAATMRRFVATNGAVGQIQGDEFTGVRVLGPVPNGDAASPDVEGEFATVRG